VIGNRVFEKIFRPKGKEEYLLEHPVSNTVNLISSARMKNQVPDSHTDLKERKNLGVDGWIILGWISRRWDVGIWTGLGWPRIETGGGRL